MSYPKRSASLIILTSLLLFVVSCAGLKINPPGPDTQSLLVLPTRLTNQAMTSKQGFYYKYKIVNSDDRSQSFDAVLKFPMRENMMIVDSLPPGNYRVTQFSYHPVGAGVSFSGNNTQRRYDTFTLESGKITIFSQSLHVMMRNETRARIGTTYFNFQMEPTTSQQEREIRETLKTLPNIETWEFL